MNVAISFLPFYILLRFYIIRFSHCVHQSAAMETIFSPIFSSRVLVVLTDIIIPCCRCVPSLRRGHKSKK